MFTAIKPAAINYERAAADRKSETMSSASLRQATLVCKRKSFAIMKKIRLLRHDADLFASATADDYLSTSATADGYLSTARAVERSETTKARRPVFLGVAFPYALCKGS